MITPDIPRNNPAFSNHFPRALLWFSDRKQAIASADALAELEYESLLVSSEKACLEQLRYQIWDVCVLDNAASAKALRRRLGEEGINVSVLVSPKESDPRRFASKLRISALGAVTDQSFPSRGVCIEIGDLAIDPNRFDAYVLGKPLNLSRREFQVLYVLSLERGGPVTAAEIAFKVGIRENANVRKAITTRIVRLRRKLLDGQSTVRISNVRAEGWSLVT